MAPLKRALGEWHSSGIRAAVGRRIHTRRAHEQSLGGARAHEGRRGRAGRECWL